MVPQGIANAAGMAAAAKMAGAQFNTDKHTIFSNHIVALCGDGCMQVRTYIRVCCFGFL